MRAVIYSSVVLLAVSLGGCGEDHMSANMGAELDKADQHMTALQAETDQHDRAVAAGTDLATVLAEEGRHQPMSMGHTGDMMSMMGNMMQMCRHTASNAAPDMQAMSDMMQSMRDECARHQVAISGAADMAAARSEEAQHLASMREMMGRMRGMMSAMRGQVGSFHCQAGMGHGI
jgi:hypothetical protein